MTADRPATEPHAFRPRGHATVPWNMVCRDCDGNEGDSIHTAAAQGAAPLDWWKRIGELVHDHAIYTKDRPDTIEVQPLYAFLDELASEGAAPPDEAYHKGWTAGYYKGLRDAHKSEGAAPLDAEQIAAILAAAEGFPGTPSLKNRALAETIATQYEGSAPRAEGPPRDLSVADLLDTLRWIIEKDGAIPAKGSDREQRFIDLWTGRLNLAAPRAEGLDYRALNHFPFVRDWELQCDCGWQTHGTGQKAEWWTHVFEALRPSDERVPEEEPR